MISDLYRRPWENCHSLNSRCCERIDKIGKISFFCGDSKLNERNNLLSSMDAPTNLPEPLGRLLSSLG